MKFVIFGAAGATGRILVERALAQGHEVTAFDRQTPTLTIHRPKFTPVQGHIPGNSYSTYVRASPTDEQGSARHFSRP